MTKLFVVICSLLSACVLIFAQDNIPNYPQCASEPVSGAQYKLFPTQNNWTFLKLDTSCGKLWQVHFSTSSTNNIAELSLSKEMLASGTNSKNGRFTLYPTENMWTFILLDQIDGRCWQVQWSWDKDNRGLIQIEPFED